MRSAIHGISLALALTAFLLGVTLPGRTEAGAWTRARGEAQLITTVAHQQAPFREDPDSTATGGSQVFQFHGEYGLAEDLSLGASFWLDKDTSDVQRGSALLGAFAQHQVWQSDDGSVASLQLAAAAPVERWIDAEFARSKPFSTAEVGLRALYGTSWWGGWGSAFVSTGAGYHLRFEDQPNEYRVETTVGVEPFDCCMAMVGLHGLMPESDDAIDPSLKIAPSLIWHVLQPDEDEPERSRRSIQLGASYDLLQPEDGFGVFLGAWHTF